MAFVVFFSMATSLLSWGLGLIFGGILVREVVKNVRGIDYRAIGAAAFVGNGSVWALGLSSSAALVMATPGVDSRGAAEDQRSDSAEPDDLHVAKRRHRGDSHRLQRYGRVFLRAGILEEGRGIVWRDRQLWK